MKKLLLRSSVFSLLLTVVFLFATCVCYAQVTPNDPYYPGQWALQKIGANYAWSTTTGSSAVTIAIIGTGVTPVSDLTGNMVSGWNTFDGNSSTADVANGGTLVAGVAAAVTNNGYGIAGVCWTCKIMPLRASDANGYGYAFAIADALTWAADHGAKVAIIDFPFTAISQVQSAAQYFFNKGGVVLAPVGDAIGFFDTTPMPLLPGTSTPSILAVGATDVNDNLYPASVTGNDIALVAPGAVTTTSMFEGFFSTLAEGTPYSAALVGGVAGLMFSANPCLSPTQVTNILIGTAVHLGTSGWNSKYGWGRIDAHHAVLTAANSSCSTTKSNSTITVTSNSDPSALGQSVTLTATASPISATGAVVFMDGTSTLANATLNAGVATFTTSNLSTGSHSITVKYAGDNNDNGSVSATLTQTVSSKNNPSVLLISSLNPSTVGQSVTFTATLSSSSATGTVTFSDETGTLGSSNISGGRATFATSALLGGSHSITASYGGDTNNNGSTSAVLTQTVNTVVVKSNTTASVSSSLNPSTSGQLVTLTSSIAPSSATGTVTFYDGSTSLGVATLQGGVAAFSTVNLAVGSHSITVVYGGDSNNNGSTSAGMTQSVKTSATAVATINSFTATPTTISEGQSATLIWSVTGATTISISNGPGTVTGMSASVSPTQTTTYTLTATNSGGSVSSQVTVTVTPVASSGVAITGSPASVTLGQTVTITGTGFLGSNIIWVTSPGIGIHGLWAPSSGTSLMFVAGSPEQFSPGVNTLLVTNANGQSNTITITVAP